MKQKKRWFVISMIMIIVIGVSGCGPKEDNAKCFVFGDTTFNSENEEFDVNPHNAYSGWACIRYGVGETLFRFDEKMELNPWIAKEYQNIDQYHWKIVLRDDVCFSNGKICDAEAVKACILALVDQHERARGDLKISEIQTDGQNLIITTSEPNPFLMNYLSEPYGCIIDVAEGYEDGIVVGTGPFVATEVVTDHSVQLVRNEHYWNGDVKLEQAKVMTISDGDTLAMALQRGEIDAAYGIAYASYPLFENDAFHISSTPTSRVFYCQMNYESELIAQEEIRQAIGMSIHKEAFVNTLLKGHGYVAESVFPESFGYQLQSDVYNPQKAKELLEAAGWVDENQDGIREKNGQRLSIKWLTYSSRQELPLLAEMVRANLAEIGIEVIIHISPDHNRIVKEKDSWDVYSAAFVTCGTGDQMYFFRTHCLKDSYKNRGAYYNENLEALANQMNHTFQIEEQKVLVEKMQQELLEDRSFLFCSFLQMSMISRQNITGLQAHACDYYELTAELDKE